MCGGVEDIHEVFLPLRRAEDGHERHANTEELCDASADALAGECRVTVVLRE